VGSGWGPAPPRVLRGGGMEVGLVLRLTFSKKFVQVEGKEEGESSLVKWPGAGIILSDRRVDHPTPPGFWGNRDFASGAYSIGTGFCGALDTGTVTPRYNGILYTGTSLLRMDLLGIYIPAPIQMDLLCKEFPQISQTPGLPYNEVQLCWYRTGAVVYLCGTILVL